MIIFKICMYVNQIIMEFRNDQLKVFNIQLHIVIINVLVDSIKIFLKKF